MSIYIATIQHGKGIVQVTQFDDKADFLDYCDDALCCTSDIPRASHSIDHLCHLLYDRGMGHFSRSHKRISRREAEKLVRDRGIKNRTLL